MAVRIVGTAQHSPEVPLCSLRTADDIIVSSTPRPHNSGHYSIEA